MSDKNHGVNNNIEHLFASDVCKLRKDPGPCKASHPRFYYDHRRMKCRRFTYGGCKGNANNFLTKHSCNKACSKGKQAN